MRFTYVIYNILSPLFMLSILVACSGGQQPTNNNVGQNKIPEPINQKVVEQIRVSNNTMESRNIPARIIEYNYNNSIESDDQLYEMQHDLLAESNVVPKYDGIDSSSWSMNTIKERMEAYLANEKTEQNVVENIQKMVFPTIQKGDKVIDLLWESNGKLFHSKCIYNKDGIVYDNILSNIAIVEETEVCSDEFDTKSRLTESLQTNTPEQSSSLTENARGQYSYTVTVRNIKITWVWGGTRGNILIQHNILWDGSNYIIDHDGTVDPWMSIGSADAQWSNNYLDPYSRSKMAWAYGWATPTASFSIKFNYSSLTFSASTSGVGSKGSGYGVHTIYI